MNRQSNKITAIYTRIDSPGNSVCIQMQRDILRRYAEKKGLSNIQFYSDNGCSGITPDRPAFQRLLADMEQGEIENLVVHGIDLYAVRDGITPESPWHPIYKRLPGAMGGGR